MKLFLIALFVIGITADRLENTYLPPNSAKTAGGNGNFIQAPFQNNLNPNNYYGASKPSNQFGASVRRPEAQYGAPLNRPENQYGAPLNRPETQYGAPLNRPEAQYGAPQNIPENQYGAPLNRPEAQYGAPQNIPENQYGATTNPSAEYGAPSNPPTQYGAPVNPSGQYGAPINPSRQYGAPKNPSTRYDAPVNPSNQYGAPTNPSAQYGAPLRQSSQYGAPSKPSTQYGAPVNPSSQYGAPKNPSTQYNAPVNPSNQYGALINPSTNFKSPGSSSHQYSSRPATNYGAPNAKTTATFQKYKESTDVSVYNQGRPVHSAPVPSNTYESANEVYEEPSRAYGAPSGQSAEARASIVRSNSENNGDGTYRFEYETENKISQQEVGELKNAGTENEATSVQGTYSYMGTDGVVYTVEYIADENGFRATGDHIPTPPPTQDSQKSGYDYSRNEQTYQAQSFNQQSPTQYQRGQVESRQYLAPAQGNFNPSNGYKY